MKTAESIIVRDSSGVEIKNYALTSGSAVYSEGLRSSNNVGFSSILVTENKAGGAGDVDISVEHSIDNVNFYTAYTSDMAGAITAEGNVVTALGNASRWIVYTSKLAPYFRFKLDPDADSQITINYMLQIER